MRFRCLPDIDDTCPPRSLLCTKMQQYQLKMMLSRRVCFKHDSRPAPCRGSVTQTARKQPSSCVHAKAQVDGSQQQSEQVARRDLLLQGFMAVAATQLVASRPAMAEEVVASAAESSLTPVGIPAIASPDTLIASPPVPSRYEDAIDKFTLEVPPGWVTAEGQIPNRSQTDFSGVTGARRTIAFFPADRAASDVSISVVVTNVSVEFTKLGSFGNVATFASNLVNSMDRSFLLRAPAWARGKQSEPIQVASLVDYSEARGRYNVEYTVQKLPDPQRHLLSTVALGSNGRYNRLYTVTAQCSEEDFTKYKPVLQAALNSFAAQLKPLA